MGSVWYDRQGAADEVLVRGELSIPGTGSGRASGRGPMDRLNG
jgi:hypothetical protein